MCRRNTKYLLPFITTCVAKLPKNMLLHAYVTHDVKGAELPNTNGQATSPPVPSDNMYPLPPHPEKVRKFTLFTELPSATC